MLLRVARKNSVFLTFFFLLIASFVLMSLDVKKRGRLNMLEEAAIDSAFAAQRGVAYSVQSLRDLWFGYVYLVGIREENRLLRKEASDLREKLNAAREAGQENQRLKALLSFKEATSYSGVTARLVGTDPTNIFKTITIGKGSGEGVAKGMAVVTSDGVVGRVIISSVNSSKVLLITDRNSDVDAVIQRSRDRGIAEGGDPGLLQLKYLPRSADAEEGDILVTSGIGGIFPKGLVIGSISKIDRSAGGIFLSAEIKPSVNFSKLEEVLVITGSPEENGV